MFLKCKNVTIYWHHLVHDSSSSRVTTVVITYWNTKPDMAYIYVFTCIFANDDNNVWSYVLLCYKVCYKYAVVQGLNLPLNDFLDIRFQLKPLQILSNVIGLLVIPVYNKQITNIV